MNDLQFCIERRKAERAAFTNVLKAVPQGRLDYKADPKARTAAELAWLIAMEEACLVTLIDTGAIEWKETPPPATVNEIVAHYEKHAALVDDRLGRLDEKAWEKKVAMLIASAPPWEAPLGEHVWGFFFDAIHHRGQLTTYLRPMGGKVPSIYGPSADAPGQ